MHINQFYVFLRLEKDESMIEKKNVNEQADLLKTTKDKIKSKVQNKLKGYDQFRKKVKV